MQAKYRNVRLMQYFDQIRGEQGLAASVYAGHRNGRTPAFQYVLQAADRFCQKRWITGERHGVVIVPERSFP
jgi:hypothetical protein